MTTGHGKRTRVIVWRGAASLALLVGLGACRSSATHAKQGEASSGGSQLDYAHLGGVAYPDDAAPRDAQNGNPYVAASHSDAPFRMTAQPHPAHNPRVVAPAVAARDFPRFVDGSARCFAQEQYWSYAPRAAAPSSGMGNGLTGGGGYGAAKGTARPAPAPAPAAQPSYKSLPPSSATASADAAPRAAAPQAERRAESEPPAYQPQGSSPGWPGARQDGAWGQAIYLSNDDTMSLSSAQRVLFAIDQYAPLPLEHVRPHELLNYFSFETAPLLSGNDFSVLASMDHSAQTPGLETLALSVQGRGVTKSTRRNANLNFVIDRSGSMAAEGRMEYLKRGLLRATQELKSGDVVNITLFDDDSCDLAQNFVVGRDSMARLDALIRRIEPRGSTNLYDGLVHGYRAAERTYQASYENRVVLITDALTNTGVVDPQMISLVGGKYDQRRIRLSGVGVGRDFNDALLDELTERGKGAYVFLGSDAEVDAVFGERFISLIETVATNVHFRLHLPPSLAMQTFFGEEASVEKSRVQAIHYFSGTSQMFLSDLQTRPGFENDDVMLSIEYEEPESGEKRSEEFVFNVSQLFRASTGVRKAQLIQSFAAGLQEMAARYSGGPYELRRYGYSDPGAAERCRNIDAELQSIAAPIKNAAEVPRVLSLWRRFCERYDGFSDSTRPVPLERHNDYAPVDTWPGAR